MLLLEGLFLFVCANTPVGLEAFWYRCFHMKEDPESIRGCMFSKQYWHFSHLHGKQKHFHSFTVSHVILIGRSSNHSQTTLCHSNEAFIVGQQGTLYSLKAS